MPTDKQVEKAHATMQKLKANYAYFFEKNESPDWIQPLRAYGYFRDPPAPEPVGDLLRFPTWPESQYLARMAAKEPDLVAEVLSEMKVTENIFVHGDIVDAARTMPGALATKLADRERRWIRSQNRLLWLLPDRYADLVVYLIDRGEANAAFELARTVLEVVSDPRSAPEPAFTTTAEPVAKMDYWDYERLIEKILPSLTRIDGLRALRLFAGILETAMNLAEPPHNGDSRDHSYIWRPAVEDHSQNEPEHSIRDALVVATRNVAEAIASSDQAQVRIVLQELEGRKRSIFRRIALHTLAQHGSSALDIARERLTDWTLFDEVNVRHEYVQLAKAHFNDLSVDQMENLLENINTPPPMENYRVNFAAMLGRPPTEDEVGQAQISWQIEKLAALGGLLPEHWKRRYDELLAGRPQPKHAEFPAYLESGWVGSTSPKSSEEIAALEVEQLVAFLNSWKPSADPFEASTEGLGQQLALAVESDPTRFGSAADRFKDLEPTYVRSILDGLESALRADSNFPWSKVLELAEHVVRRTFERDDDATGIGLTDRDPGWRWARGSLADLLKEGFSRDKIPFDERSRAWGVLRRLVDDPNPSPTHEATYGGQNMDALTLSLNTNRGKAMQAIVRYALWVRRSDERLHQERLDQGFGAMPEVREVLDDHLNPASDPSLAIRAVYGQWFPWLALIDVEWARSNVVRVFPGQTAPQLHAAAWESYLMNPPYDTPFGILRSQYEAAVEALPWTDKSVRRRRLDPTERLAEHLMILLIRGTIPLDDRVITRFFEVASDDIRQQTLSFVGRVLQNVEAPTLTVPQVTALQALWSMRLSAFDSDPNGRKEIGAIGSWFASSGRLPDDWLMAQLLEVLARRVPIEFTHRVMERLADLAATRPYETVRVVRLVVAIQDEPGLHLLGREAIGRVISAAAISDDERARDEAGRLLNELAARRYSDYDDLAKDFGA